MTGPEHFRRAEAILDSCQVVASSDVDDDDRVVEHYPETFDGTRDDVDPLLREYDPSNALRAAKVHALLSLAAVMSWGQVSEGYGRE